MYSIIKQCRASVLYVLILAEDLDAPSMKLGRLTVGRRAFPLGNPVYTEQVTVLFIAVFTHGPQGPGPRAANF